MRVSWPIQPSKASFTAAGRGAALVRLGRREAVGLKVPEHSGLVQGWLHVSMVGTPRKSGGAVGPGWRGVDAAGVEAADTPRTIVPAAAMGTFIAPLQCLCDVEEGQHGYECFVKSHVGEPVAELPGLFVTRFR